MSFLMEKAHKDFDIVMMAKKENDEYYMDICCYHIQQAIEKLLKAFIELKGERYAFTHDVSRLYENYIQLGGKPISYLDLMGGTLTAWESGSRYKDSFFATMRELDSAIEIYHTLDQFVSKEADSFFDLIPDSFKEKYPDREICIREFKQAIQEDRHF